MNSHSGSDEVEKLKERTANVQPRGNDNGVRIDSGSSDNRLEHGKNRYNASVDVPRLL